MGLSRLSFLYNGDSPIKEKSPMYSVLNIKNE